MHSLSILLLFSIIISWSGHRNMSLVTVAFHHTNWSLPMVSGSMPTLELASTFTRVDTWQVSLPTAASCSASSVLSSSTSARSSSGLRQGVSYHAVMPFELFLASYQGFCFWQLDVNICDLLTNPAKQFCRLRRISVKIPVY